MTDCIQFNFTLEPIELIEPWGADRERKLHWFGLTSGLYWIKTSQGDVLRYTDEATEQFGTTFPYVDYQVARLFEDLQQQRPYALEAVPEDMGEIASDPEWYRRSKAWRDAQPGDAGELWFDGLEWWHAREMDSAYLRHGPIFSMWRQEEEAHFRWRYSGREPVWCVPNGEVRMPLGEFSKAVDSFLDGVLAAMRDRVDGIARRGWLRTDCSVDVDQLVAEQAERAQTLQRFKVRSPNTNWGEQRAAFEKLRMKVEEEGAKP